jgi:hypothetical protein
MTEEQAREEFDNLRSDDDNFDAQWGTVMITSNKKNHFMNGALYTKIQSTLNKKINKR